MGTMGISNQRGWGSWLMPRQGTVTLIEPSNIGVINPKLLRQLTRLTPVAQTADKPAFNNRGRGAVLPSNTDTR